MIPNKGDKLPTIPPVQHESIPQLIKQEKRWLGWWTGPLKTNGKFDKFPVDPLSGHRINPLDPANWLTFDEALAAHRRGMAKGVGFVLSDRHPIISSGTPYYLTAIDLDHCLERMGDHQALWRDLGRPYVEVSPSGKGLRMLGLSAAPLKGGNAGDGRELYSSGRFMTITGIGARGSVQDISAPLTALEQRWFPTKAVPNNCLPPQSSLPSRPETPRNVETILSMLDKISSDTTYETWRDIVWAVASTGWASAPQIVHGWSARASHRYDRAALDALLRQFSPSRGITLGTLTHHAKLNGWAGDLHQLIPALPATASAATLGPNNSLLLTAAELRLVPPTPYVVRGLLPAQGLAALYGEPGSGKSFLALDLAHAIATGRTEWFGFPVRQAPVVYVALEGQGGIGKRIDALEQHVRTPCNDLFRFWRSDIQLLADAGGDLLCSQIVATMGKGAVVVIDTLNQAAPGADENSSQDMGKIIAGTKRLAAAVEGLVILVHHAGKNRSLGLRGHSSLLAAMDAVIEVAKEPAGRSWRVTKAKDDDGNVTKDFDLLPYDVGQDDYGALTSCAVQQTAHVGIAKKAPVKGSNQKAALTELQRLLPSAGQVVDYPTALQHVAAVLNVTKGKGRDRAKEAIGSLIRGGHLSLTNGGLCLV